MQPDLLCGGFPCQDLSVAGQRRGLAGDRSGLFFEFARIIDAFQPRWVLLENVPGLLSSNGGRDFGVVLATLADLGYGVAWRTLDSRFFGVPQRRRRVFILGTVADGDPAAAAARCGEVLAVGARCSGHPATSSEEGPDDSAASVAGTLGGRRGFTGDDIDRGGPTSLSGIGNGGPDDNDAQAGRLVVADTVRSHPRPGSNSDGKIIVSKALTASAGPRHDTSAETLVTTAFASKGGGGGAFSEEDVSPTLSAHGENEVGQPPAIVVPPLVSRSSRGNAQGNSPGHNADESLVAFLPTGGGAKGLSPSDDLAPGTGTGTGGTVSVAVDAAVRRLTPVECERLQGLPDDWTAPDELGGPGRYSASRCVEGVADSARYSAIGDAVTATVAEWIGRRIIAADQETAA